MRSRRLFPFLLSATLLAAGAFSASAQAPAAASGQIHIRSIGPVITTVAEMDRSVEFYSHVLTFERVSDTEVAGDELEHLFGVFGSRARIVRMRLGGESIEFVQFLAPRGRPIPVDSRSNDLWFQHFAVIVSDMVRAMRFCGKTMWNMPRPVRSGCRIGTRTPAASKLFISKIPTDTLLKSFIFPPAKATRNGRRRPAKCFSGSTTRRSPSRTPTPVLGSTATSWGCAVRERVKTTEPSKSI